MTREEAINEVKKAIPTMWKETKDALDILIPEFAESEDERDERIRKAIVHLLTVASESYLIDATGFKKEQFLFWLEKQKEQKPLITGNDFGWIDELKHDLKHPEELDEKVQEVLKKRQKPVEYLSKRKVYDIMNKLTELSTSELIPFESEEYVKIHEITSDVCSLLDYPIEQKPAERSLEDDHIIGFVYDLLNEIE